MAALSTFRSRVFTKHRALLMPATPRPRGCTMRCSVATLCGPQVGYFDRKHLADIALDEATDDDDSCSLILDWNLHTSGAARCALLRLERLVRDVSAVGGARALFWVLSQRRRQLFSSGASEQFQTLSSSAAASSSRIESTKIREAEMHLRELFLRADTNCNGEIDKQEFIAALNVLGASLSPAEMEQVAAALQVGGHISEAEFMEIASLL